ncbi:MAG: carboxymuconolactone decarboxylase family protein [Candidatus Rokubacteria bacterium]|nr:carboxymuconolactone decarboxylase family protein [Candidatus Rokubacteria bacterium]
MARIPTIERKEQLPAEHQAVYERIGASRGKVAGPFAVLLHSPTIAGRAADLGAYIRFESQLDGRDRELAVLAVARALDCRYEWAAHAREARRAGVREEAIAAVRDGRAPAGLTAEEALVVSYVRQLLAAHRVDEPTFAALRDRLGVERLVELTATVGYYAMLACSLNAFEVLPPPEDDALPV